MENMETVKGIYRDIPNGTPLWDVSNGIMVILLWVLLSFLLIQGLSQLASYNQVKKNWEQYRCSPSVMPFASFYGYDTGQNFNYCLTKIFDIHSGPYTSSFTSMFQSIAVVLSTLLSSLNSLRLGLATLGGGINVIVQEFVDRITAMFDAMRTSAIRIKNLMSRLYATFFAIIYIALSAITGVQNFGNTVLFKFLDTFCFDPDTIIEIRGKGYLRVKDVSIGDIILPGNERVTATFKFYSDGQPMVSLPRNDGKENPIIVSTNHYVLHNGKSIRSEGHPDAYVYGSWSGGVLRPLICFNTNKHTITFGGYTFIDYDETAEGDKKTMMNLQGQINGCLEQNTHLDSKEKQPVEYSPSVHPETRIKLKDGRGMVANNILLGDILSGGGKVVGIIDKEVYEITRIPMHNKSVGAATLVWDLESESWKRAKELWPSTTIYNSIPTTFRSFIVTPNSQIEIATYIPNMSPLVIRDYLEVCSPDSEKIYSTLLENGSSLPESTEVKHGSA